MLVGEKVVLRPWSSGDLATLYSIRNNLPLQRQLMTLPRGNSLDDVRDWLISRSKNACGIFLIVASTHLNQTVGYIQVDELDILNGSGRLGICIAPESQGMGYGREAITLLEIYLRDVFNLRKLLLEVLAENIVAINLYSKQRFREVGRMKDHFLFNKRYLDVIIMEKMI